MSRRTREAAQRIRMKILMEENNGKSPDIPTVTITAKNASDACLTAAIFCDITETEFPFGTLESWGREIRYPVSLYFPFKRKREWNQFLRTIRRELGAEVEMIF